MPPRPQKTKNETTAKMGTEPPRPKLMIVNGELVAFGDAKVHLMAPAVRYGLTVFEGLRGYWNAADRVLNVFRLADHMRRLEHSMKILRFEPRFAVKELSDSLARLLAAENIREHCHIRVNTYIDGFGDHHATGPVSYFVHAAPLPRSPNTRSGIRCAVSSWMRIADSAMPPRAKTGANYVNARLARMQAKQDGYDDAILLCADGRVSEGPGAAIFLVRGSKLVTPDVTSGILESITRDTIITLARERGLGVEERTVDRTELYVADEVFLAGTAAEIVPVVDVDGLVLGQGKIGNLTAELQRAYFEVVEGNSLRHKSWLTPIPGEIREAGASRKGE